MPSTERHGCKIAVQFDHVTKRFLDRDIITGISLKVVEGSFTVFVGPSGCGKSTLLNMAAGLDFPSEGYVFVHGRETAGPTPSTALLFQNYNLFPWMTALDNVAFGLRNNGLGRAEARREAAKLLAKVGLADYAGKVPSELSGGMQQRVALVRAFALKPRLLLLDEPFAALDFQTRRMMQAYLLATWLTSGATVIMVTHDLGEALMLADRVVLVSGSPGLVSDLIDLDAPRPRDPDDPILRAASRRLEAHLESEVARGEFSPEELASVLAFTRPSRD